jgi:hypothetical protein
MKKHKLALSKETIRPLQGGQLAEVGGGSLMIRTLRTCVCVFGPIVGPASEEGACTSINITTGGGGGSGGLTGG